MQHGLDQRFADDEQESAPKVPAYIGLGFGHPHQRSLFEELPAGFLDQRIDQKVQVFMLDLNEIRLGLVGRPENDEVGPLQISGVHDIAKPQQVQHDHDGAVEGDARRDMEILDRLVDHVQNDRTVGFQILLVLWSVGLPQGGDVRLLVEFGQQFFETQNSANIGRDLRSVTSDLEVRRAGQKQRQGSIGGVPISLGEEAARVEEGPQSSQQARVEVRKIPPQLRSDFALLTRARIAPEAGCGDRRHDGKDPQICSKIDIGDRVDRRLPGLRFRLLLGEHRSSRKATGAQEDDPDEKSDRSGVPTAERRA